MFKLAKWVSHKSISQLSLQPNTNLINTSSIFFHNPRNCTLHSIPFYARFISRCPSSPSTMASSPSSLSVSVEFVSACKLNVRRGGGGDCSAFSCAGKVPRALTGSLASTTQCSSFSPSRPRIGRYRYRCEPVGSNWTEASCSKDSGWISRLSLRHSSSERRKCRCSPTFGSGSFDDISAESLWEDLKPTISYLPVDELTLVWRALELAFEAHNGQKRRSGEPFIIHPVEVARILGELELDWESIAAGLLHDTVEDTNVVTFERIEKDFGFTVRRIVEGETKVSKLGKLKYKHKTSCDVKADDLRQMFLAMTEEVRVIIVKLADRLHNMRTLSHMPPHKQASIALETLQVFAPLAKLLGMYQIKCELENLSFMYTNTQDYEKITKRVAELYEDHERELGEANKILVEKIEDDQFLELVTVRTEVRAVLKKPYSIYKAVTKAKVSISEVNQIAQLQIIIKPKPCNGIGPLCSSEQIGYHVLGLVHSIWTPIPRSVTDYIASPKPNGYQSLHTTVIPFLYESMFRLEVQIRTEEMDLIAQRGIAAHYCGKVTADGMAAQLMSRNSVGKSACFKNSNVALRIGWLHAIREWQEEFVGNMSSREFVDVITRDLLGSRVFVFTPRGETKNMPKGATVVDYAYMIHTEIGNKMVAAKVNGNLVSPTHVLDNAEVVEIITYDALSNKSAFEKHKLWLQHAKTRSARHKIMRYLREQASLSAEEITADLVNNLNADSDKKDMVGDAPDVSGMGEIFEALLSRSPEVLRAQNGAMQAPKVNGKHNKHVGRSKLKEWGQLLSRENDIAKTIHANTARPREVLPGLENWQSSKIAAWHCVEGNSIEWLSVVCIDRRGIMGEVVTVLASLGFSVCSCVAEIDRGRGMGVMLFHIEGSTDNMVDACARIDLVFGVLGWSLGCSLVNSTEPH